MHLLSRSASWYWTVIALAAIIVLAIFVIPESVATIAVRQLLGPLYVLVLPGYSFTKALFPSAVPIPTRSRGLDSIERTVLSVGMSIAIVAITGILLNVTPWGIGDGPTTLSLLALILAFATTAVVREHLTTDHARGDRGRPANATSGRNPIAVVSRRHEHRSTGPSRGNLTPSLVLPTGREQARFD